MLRSEDSCDETLSSSPSVISSIERQEIPERDHIGVENEDSCDKTLRSSLSVVSSVEREAKSSQREMLRNEDSCKRELCAQA